MGIMDTIKEAIGGNAGSLGSMGDNAKVAGGFLEAVKEQPGGIAGVFQSFQQNGMGGLVQQWAGGQTQAKPTPDQVDQGLGNTGLIDRTAEKAGVSPAIVKTALAMAIPFVIHHFVSSGHVTAEGQPTGQPAPEHEGMLANMLHSIGRPNG